MIEKWCNKTLKLKYLTNIDITLKKIREMAQAHETAHRHASEFENATASENVNYTQSSKGKYKCYIYGKLGHFARNCRSKMTNGQQSSKNKRSGNYRQFHKPSGSNYEKSRYEGKNQQYNDQKMNNNKRKNFRENVLCVDDAHKDNSESENEYAFSVSANHQHIIVNVNNVPISMIVDSGASCNIINSDIARKLVNNGAKSVQKKTKIYPNGSPAIISHHYIQGTISYNGIDVSARFIVIDGEDSFLLGKDTAEEIGVLRTEINAMNTESIINEYPNVTQKKLGKLQNMSVDLQIDKSVPATIHKHYCIPFHLRSKVKA